MFLNNIIFNGLIFEVTRRCNMQCPHCLRGDAQNKDLDFKYIDTFLYRLRGRCVREIFFTGGEPSLNIEAIKYVISGVKKYNIQVKRYDLITNGKNLSDEFINFVNSVDSFRVAISMDSYHEKLSDNDIQKLYQITSLSTKDIEPTSDTILDIGLARKNKIGIQKWKSHSVDFSFYKNNLYVINMLVLNCDGNVLSGCDYEYSNAESLKISRFDSDIIGTLFNMANDDVLVQMQCISRANKMYEFIDWLKEQNLLEK